MHLQLCFLNHQITFEKDINDNRKVRAKEILTLKSNEGFEFFDDDLNWEGGSFTVDPEPFSNFKFKKKTISFLESYFFDMDTQYPIIFSVFFLTKAELKEFTEAMKNTEDDKGLKRAFGKLKSINDFGTADVPHKMYLGISNKMMESEYSYRLKTNNTATEFEDYFEKGILSLTVKNEKISKIEVKLGKHIMFPKPDEEDKFPRHLLVVFEHRSEHFIDNYYTVQDLLFPYKSNYIECPSRIPNKVGFIAVGLVAVVILGIVLYLFVFRKKGKSVKSEESDSST